MSLGDWFLSLGFPYSLISCKKMVELLSYHFFDFFFFSPGSIRKPETRGGWGWWIEMGCQEQGKTTGMSSRVGDGKPEIGEGLGLSRMGMGAGKGGKEEGRERGEGERERERLGGRTRDETKRLLVTTSTWEALHFQSACLSLPFFQGVASGPDPGL